MSLAARTSSVDSAFGQIHKAPAVAWAEERYIPAGDVAVHGVIASESDSLHQNKVSELCGRRHRGEGHAEAAKSESLVGHPSRARSLFLVSQWPTRCGREKRRLAAATSLRCIVAKGKPKALGFDARHRTERFEAKNTRVFGRPND
jgi:hypothetical protein